jgi:hypothetical protein
VLTPNPQLSWVNTIVGTLPPAMVPKGNAEMHAIAVKVEARKEELETTVFRVGFLNDGPADVGVYAGYQGPDYKGSMSLSRSSMSRWLLQEADERRWIGGAPSLGNY